MSQPKRAPISGQVKHHAEQAVKQATASPWFERLARFGYAAKGAVYIVVGLLAAMAAFGTGGKTTDTRGALETIVEQPFGRVLLGAVAIGLIGYALWRFVQAFADAENKGSDAKGIGVRTGYAISALVHVGLALSAAQMALGSSSRSGGSDRAEQGWTASLMAQPFGRWLVAALGAIIIGVGIFQLYKAYTAKFREELKLGEMSSTEQTWATRSGRLGFAARGVVFSVIGIFLMLAALRSDPGEVRGLSGALRALEGQPFGSVILGVVAIGLIAYGVFMFVAARYRRIAAH